MTCDVAAVCLNRRRFENFLRSTVGYSENKFQHPTPDDLVLMGVNT